jgi:hypothetical protein
MSEGHKSALKEAIATAAERAETAPRQAQGELFGSLTTIDLAAAFQPDVPGGEERAPRGPSRPPGSRNWRTQGGGRVPNAPLRVKSTVGGPL